MKQGNRVTDTSVSWNTCNCNMLQHETVSTVRTASVWTARLADFFWSSECLLPTHAQTGWPDVYELKALLNNNRVFTLLALSKTSISTASWFLPTRTTFHGNEGKATGAELLHMYSRPNLFNYRARTPTLWVSAVWRSQVANGESKRSPMTRAHGPIVCSAVPSWERHPALT